MTCGTLLAPLQPGLLQSVAFLPLILDYFANPEVSYQHLKAIVMRPQIRTQAQLI